MQRKGRKQRARKQETRRAERQPKGCIHQHSHVTQAHPPRATAFMPLPEYRFRYGSLHKTFCSHFKTLSSCKEKRLAPAKSSFYVTQMTVGRSRSCTCTCSCSCSCSYSLEFTPARAVSPAHSRIVEHATAAIFHGSTVTE